MAGFHAGDAAAADAGTSPDAAGGPAAAPIGEAVPEALRDVIEQINGEAAEWRELLTVSIGRASELTELKDNQIRYFEALQALHPAKQSGQAGANRLYSLADLRRLRALSLLLGRGMRSAEAAALVRRFVRLIDSAGPASIEAAIERESTVITDGFLLSRLASQLLGIVEAELNRGHQRVALVGALLPRRNLIADTSDDATIQQVGQRLAESLADMPVALNRAALVRLPEDVRVPASLRETGSDASTILFYSRESWRLPAPEAYRYCLFDPGPGVRTALLLIVEATADIPPRLVLPDRPRRLLARILELVHAVQSEFAAAMPRTRFRYRSDGYRVEESTTSYRAVLSTLRKVLFPDDPASKMALLVPNALGDATSLSMLAQVGYQDDLAQNVKLDLAGEGRGLSGLAYKLREPFYSLHADTDPRVAHAIDERSKVALAVPLAINHGLPPFGVLYLASSREDGALGTEGAYLGMVLGTIFGELLGRWWLVRLRRTLEESLHHHLDETMSWLESLDTRGPGFHRAVERIAGLWEAINDNKLVPDGRELALVLFDIDRHYQNAASPCGELARMHTQLHVRRAIERVAPDQQEQAYWFKADHALLLLDGYSQAKAIELAQRITRQVSSLPLDLPGVSRPLTVTVSASVKVLTYSDLRHLSTTGTNLRERVSVILDDMRQQTRSPESGASRGSLRVFSPMGWIDHGK